MPKLPVISGVAKGVRAFQRRAGVWIGSEGSHVVLLKGGHIANLSIPQHKELAPGTLRSLLRDAEMTVPRNSSNCCDPWPPARELLPQELRRGVPFLGGGVEIDLHGVGRLRRFHAVGAGTLGFSGIWALGPAASIASTSGEAGNRPTAWPPPGGDSRG